MCTLTQPLLQKPNLLESTETNVKKQSDGPSLPPPAKFVPPNNIDPNKTLTELIRRAKFVAEQELQNKGQVDTRLRRRNYKNSPQPTNSAIVDPDIDEDSSLSELIEIAKTKSSAKSVGKSPSKTSLSPLQTITPKSQTVLPQHNQSAVSPNIAIDGGVPLNDFTPKKDEKELKKKKKKKKSKKAREPTKDSQNVTASPKDTLQSPIITTESPRQKIISQNITASQTDTLQSPIITTQSPPQIPTTVTPNIDENVSLNELSERAKNDIQKAEEKQSKKTRDNDKKETERIKDSQNITASQTDTLQSPIITTQSPPQIQTTVTPNIDESVSLNEFTPKKDEKELKKKKKNKKSKKAREPTKDPQNVTASQTDTLQSPIITTESPPKIPTTVTPNIDESVSLNELNERVQTENDGTPTSPHSVTTVSPQTSEIDSEAPLIQLIQNLEIELKREREEKDALKQNRINIKREMEQLQTFCSSRDFESALNIFRKNPHEKTATLILYHLFLTLDSSKVINEDVQAKIDMAIEIKNTLLKKGATFSPINYFYLLSLARESRHGNLVFHIFEEMLSLQVELNTFSFIQVLKHVRSHSSLKRASWVNSQLIQILLNDPKITLLTEDFQLFFDNVRIFDQKVETVELMKYMIDNNITIDSHCLLKAMSVFMITDTKKGHEIVFRAVKRMEKMYFESYKFRNEFGHIHRMFLLSCLYYSGNIKEAENFFNNDTVPKTENMINLMSMFQLQSKNPQKVIDYYKEFTFENSEFLTMVLQACYSPNLENLMEGYKIAFEVEKKMIETHQQKNITALNCLMGIYGETKDFVQVNKIMKDIFTNPKLVPNRQTFETFVNSLSIAFPLKDIFPPVMKFYQQFTHTRTRTLDYKILDLIIEVAYECGDYATCLRLFFDFKWGFTLPLPSTLTIITKIAPHYGPKLCETVRNIENVSVQHEILNNDLALSILKFYFSIAKIELAIRFVEKATHLKFSSVIDSPHFFTEAIFLLFQHKQYHEVIFFYHKMKERHIQRNEFLYSVVMYAYLNIQDYVCVKDTYNEMTVKGLTPNIHHYNCVVEAHTKLSTPLFKVLYFINSMKVTPQIETWQILKQAAIEKKEEYIIEKCQKEMGEPIPKKEKREYADFSSTIEVNGSTHTFTNYSSNHEEISQVLKEVKSLFARMKENNAPDSLLDENYMYYSERQALAYGLIKTAPGFPLIITKSVPLSQQSHNFFNYISKFLNRGIVLTDPNYHHFFSNGECSCAGEAYTKSTMS